MTEEDAQRRERWAVWAVLVLIAVLFACAITVIWRTSSASPTVTTRVSPGQAPPTPEPLVFAPIAADKAKQLNEAIPFAPDRGPAARPFALAGAPESRERAVDCLASAMLYEAGGDQRGQQAVAQVVLNRVRHPAYPGTICGVVFQGSERRTGCQFTFTCDGAMRRVPPAAAFAVAQGRARAMLEGRVQDEVGLATHYHTDWVHPVWSARLEKIAQVDTHLFFRWAGTWGSAAAQRKPYLGGEPVEAALALLSPAHRPALLPSPTVTGDPLLAKGAQPGMPQASDLGSGRFRIYMSAARSANVQAATARDLCGTREYCKLTGVLDGGEVVFVYLRSGGIERALWDCDTFKRPSNRQCFGKTRDIPDAPRAKETAPSGK